ncbi:Txe/YoeB family addiction module toxin [Arthrospiribacter ruber]|jgi:toxin YoeB|uniref:Toxin YoeB n=1 Tax=Arthrospiribacter ruber TaxID=2487934 RepID=A0A951MD57_9BACT|nr:Txe/YoeB family addiction module toxin [Arthrospiribacter ruber]MBW3470246.1 Txe/YoeB family addiction module toxin [Arthrospiribacter ruber]
MKIIFLSSAWEDYLYWQQTDKKTLKKINELIKVSMRSPYDGIGKPEPLKHELSGWWSRRINLEHRLVYRTDNDSIYILQCRYHY